MKVKILIAPLMIVTIICLLAWLVYPAYTEINAKRAEHKTQQALISDISQKVANLQSASALLSSPGNKVRKDVLYGYVPEAMNEEDVINNLNTLAYDGGLFILNISVSSLDKKSSAVSSATVNMEGQAILSDSQIAAQNAVPVASPDTFSVNYNVSGSYDEIKRVFDKIYKLERFNSIVTMDVAQKEKKGTEGEGGSSENGDDLTVTATLKFAFFSQPKTTNTDPSNPIFSQSKIDDKVIDEIIKAKSVDVLRPVVDAAGRSNPFLP